MSRFTKWKWLHYDAARDLLFCHVCVTGIKSGKLILSGNAILSGGFSNWKDATRCFIKHETSSTHKTAVDAVVTVPRTCTDVGDMLSASHASEKKANQYYVYKVIENIQFLSRQGIALCGDGNEKDSNFMQLLLLRSANHPTVLSFLERKTDNYTSPQIQNEILKVKSLQILRDY